MNVTLEPASAGVSRGWAVLIASWRRMTERSAANAEIRKTAEAIALLSQLDDRELSDMGLGRSDLSADGLAAAGAWRSLRQAALDAEIAERR